MKYVRKKIKLARVKRIIQAQKIPDFISSFSAKEYWMHAPGELGDLADKVHAIGALLGLVINVDQTDIVPQRNTFLLSGMHSVKTVFDRVVLALVHGFQIIVRSKGVLLTQTAGWGIIERDELFFHLCSKQIEFKIWSRKSGDASKPTTREKL